MFAMSVTCQTEAYNYDSVEILSQLKSDVSWRFNRGITIYRTHLFISWLMDVYSGEANHDTHYFNCNLQLGWHI